MRIAQVAPLYESVPPQLYGGTERVVAYLTDELVRMGHDVTLFASGDSDTRARLVAVCPRSLRLDPKCVDPLAHHILMLEQVMSSCDQFDVLHFHIDYLHFPLSRRLAVPHVTTLHGRLDLPDLAPLYAEFNDVPVVSISDAQREPLPNANWQGTVYHGLPLDLHSFQERSGGHLAFLGRVSPEKRLDLAIEIAGRAGRELLVAAKVAAEDEDYFHTKIEPLLSQPHVKFIGEIGEADKEEFLGGAAALVFPIDWPEPFGLVMIESMACGTPVIAFRRGSVPEVLDDGTTGFLCDDVEQAVAAVGRLDRFNRRDCRTVFEKRFSAARMAEDYVNIYRRLVENSHGPNRRSQRSILHSGHLAAARRTAPRAETG